MIEKAVIENSKALIEAIADLLPSEIFFAIIEEDTIIWTKSSQGLNLEIFHVGDKLRTDSTTMQAMRDRKTMIQNVPRAVYGARLKIVSIPVVNEDTTIYGALSIVIPILHPVIAAFPHFAPVMAEMFSEGSFMYATDLKKIIENQPSKKFSVNNYEIGKELVEEDLSYKVINSKKPKFQEYGEERFGVPVSISNFPLFADANQEEMVGTLGIVLPKKTAAVLRKMSVSLENGLTDISSAIQELAASAVEINANEEALNENINDIISISDEINEISLFIKDIAEETKLLGLNASIEAARVGDAGRGFGVVADEIRKLSAESKSTVPKINSLTESIRNKVEEAGKKSTSSLDSSQEQASATEEITASIEEITSMSAELGRMAADL